MPEQWRVRNTCSYANAKVRVAELAERQWGVVAQAQLLDHGVNRMSIKRWIQEQRLFRVHPGVYAVGHPALAPEGKLAAALFYAGKGAALWGVTAGYWLGFLRSRPHIIHVCTPRRCRSLRGVEVHARRKVQRIVYKRLPVSPPAQALLEMASQLGPASQLDQVDLRRALAEAEYRRLVTLTQVALQLGRGKRGSANLRKALEHHLPNLAKTKSVLEVKFLLLCERYSLTPPDDINVDVAGWKVDAVWYAQKVVVELDSRLAHEAHWRQDRDHQRDVDLRAAGYTVLRYTWQQVTETPELVAADLRRALGL